MSSDEEHKKQSHKGHKVNLKLKKKWKLERDQKKKKTLSNKAYALIKDDERCKYFSQKDKIKSHQSLDVWGIRTDLLNNLLRKFLNTYHDELQDFYDVFKQLDEGAEIETSGIDNEIIQRRLEQIFKILKLTKLIHEDETRYKHTIPGLKLQDYIKLKIDFLMDDVDNVDQEENAEDSHVFLLSDYLSPMSNQHFKSNLRMNHPNQLKFTERSNLNPS